MNGDDLKKIIESINSAKQYFKGVFSINTLPKKLSCPSFVICNYDIDTNPGSHWFCLFKAKKSNLECFDSLGLNEEKVELIQKYCKIQYISHFTFNETQVQSNCTSTCGKFVLYFALQRLHNLDLSFPEILNEIFQADINKNELNVANFLQNINNEQPD